MKRNRIVICEGGLPPVNVHETEVVGRCLIIIRIVGRVEFSQWIERVMDSLQSQIAVDPIVLVAADVPRVGHGF